MLLASAVISFLLTHCEAVTGYPAGRRLASFYTLTWCHENIYLCVDTLKAKEYHHNLILIPIHMSQDTTSQTSPLPTSEEIRISSVSEFIEKIVQRDKEAGTEIFYRGHADKGWELLPSIFRTPNGVEKEHLLFHDMVAHEPQSFSECKSTLDYLVQMQHYGLPTRLLDMTTNPLVALYFACEQVDGDVSAGVLAGSQAALRAVKEVWIASRSAEKTEPEKVAEAIEAIKGAAQMLTEMEPEANFITIARALALPFLEASTQEKAIVMAAAESIAKPMIRPVLMIAAIAGAVAGAGAVKAAGHVAMGLTVVEEAYYRLLQALANPNANLVDVPAVELLTKFTFNPSSKVADNAVAVFTVALATGLGSDIGEAAGFKARGKDGVVYLFSIPEDKVKHYDSDTVSALANLAKCKISEQCSSCLSVEDFNDQLDIKFLLHQIKGEKPHFLPRIQPLDLSNLFFVKAKNGNQRIANQMGAFLLFGLGVKQTKASGSDGEVNLLTKSEHAEVPAEWIKKKLIIPKECKADILEELAQLGITESYIYPGMEQYAKELKKKYEL